MCSEQQLRSLHFPTVQEDSCYTASLPGVAMPAGRLSLTSFVPPDAVTPNQLAHSAFFSEKERSWHQLIG
eukprot:5197597-Karenia_brevis.AAC.1